MNKQIQKYNILDFVRTKTKNAKVMFPKTWPEKENKQEARQCEVFLDFFLSQP